MIAATVLPAALLVDLALGDPRWLPHPVRGLGRWYGLVERRCWRDRHGAGIAGWLAVVGPAVAVAGGLTWLAAAWWHPAAGAAVAVAAVWLAIAARDLADHALRVARPLRGGDLPAARQAVAMIVGRDTADLEASEVARAAVEAVAESTVDGVVAPLWWAAVGLVLAGAPGAAAGAWLFRAANTLDSAWGHRDARYRRFGWCAARADDALAYLPARLAAALLVVLGGHPLRTLRAWWRDAHRHASPNAGRAEAAMAGALDVRLGGSNRYDGEPHDGPLFHAGGRPPQAMDIVRAVRRMLATAVGATALLALLAHALT